MQDQQCKELAIHLTKEALEQAELQLYRANIRFGQLSEKLLHVQFGATGKTCGELLDEAATHRDKVKTCLDWLQQVPLPDTPNQ